MTTAIEIRQAAINSVRAFLRSGEAIGPEYDGDHPTELAWRDGKWTAYDPARRFFRLHNPLPWSLWELNGALGDAVRKWTDANTRGAEIAHWGRSAGFDGRETSGTIGHWCHAENWLGIDHARWEKWLAAVKAAPRPNWTLVQSRDIHTHWLRLYRSLKWESWIHAELQRLGWQLAQAPLRQHGVPIWNPAWIGAAYQYGIVSDDWVVQGATDCRDLDECWPLSLAALAYRITGDKSHLLYQLPRLVAWPRRLYREPGSPINWYWLPQGQQIPHQWAGFALALEKAGIDLASVPLPPGGYPYSYADRGDGMPGGLVLRGNDLRMGTVRWLALDGSPTRQVEVVATVADGTVNSLWTEGPFWFAMPVRELYIRTDGCQASIQAPVTDDPAEHAVLTRGLPYTIGNARGTLAGGFNATLAMVGSWWLNLRLGGGEPLGMWAGKAQPVTFGLSDSASLAVELSGHDYGMAKLTCEREAVWRAA